jgi:hypothetical protein
MVEHVTLNHQVLGSSPSWGILYCGCSSVVESVLAKHVVVGSNPIARSNAKIAQLVEQWSEEPRVGSSILSLGILHFIMEMLWQQRK